jgi:hypothetical protein
LTDADNDDAGGSDVATDLGAFVSSCIKPILAPPAAGEFNRTLRGNEDVCTEYVVAFPRPSVSVGVFRRFPDAMLLVPETLLPADCGFNTFSEGVRCGRMPPVDDDDLDLSNSWDRERCLSAILPDCVERKDDKDG